LPCKERRYQWEWEDDRKGDRSVKKCVHMYVNAKTMPIETIPGIGGGGNKGEW
jgi:hypothetical protein